MVHYISFVPLAGNQTACKICELRRTSPNDHLGIIAQHFHLSEKKKKRSNCSDGPCMLRRNRKRKFNKKPWRYQSVHVVIHFYLSLSYVPMYERLRSFFPCTLKSNKIVHLQSYFDSHIHFTHYLLMYLIDELSRSIFVQRVQGILAVNVENFNKTQC